MEQLQPKSERRSYVEYIEVTQPEIIERNNQKYQFGIKLLKEVGFDEVHFFREKTAALGFVTNFPLVFLKLIKGELLSPCRLLSLCIYYPVLINFHDKAFAQLLAGTGIKFGTPFTDGSWVISTRFSSISYKLLGDTVYLNKIGSSLSVEDAWRNHQKKVEKLIASGKQVTKEVQVENYISWCHHADSANQQVIKTVGVLWLFCVVFLLSFALLRVAVAIWPQMPDIVLIILRLLPLFLPLIVMQLYTKQFGDISQSAKPLKN